MLEANEGLKARQKETTYSISERTLGEGAIPLNVVIRERTTVFKGLASEEQILYFGGNKFLTLKFFLHIVDRVCWRNLQHEHLSGHRLHEDPRAFEYRGDKMKDGVLSNVVVRERVAAVVKYEGEPLLVRGDTLLILDFGLHVINPIRWLNVEWDGLAGRGLDRDLHTTKATKYYITKCQNVRRDPGHKGNVNIAYRGGE